MKKCFFLLLTIIAILRSNGQIMINLQLPPIGITLKSQLWNLTIVNTSNQDINGKIQLMLTNTANNQKVLTGTSRPMLFPKGIKQILAIDVNPVVYNVLSPGTGVDASPNGFLPIGIFDICYSVQKVTGDFYEQLSEECVNIQIEPLSPPQLAYPPNHDYVDRSRPLFSWIPPMPLNAFNNVTYSYVLVEVQATQSSADAIQQNFPIATVQQIKPVSYQYPLSLPALDTGKLYAWRIVAQSGGANIANSDVWTFRVKNPLPQTSPSVAVQPYYLKLKPLIDGSVALCRGPLYYEYDNEWNDSPVQFRLMDVTSAERTELQTDSSWVTVKFGQNLNKMDLPHIPGIIDKHIYLLELINGKSEHWYVKFEYRKP